MDGLCELPAAQPGVGRRGRSGPLAGYFAHKRRPELHLQPVSPPIDAPMLPMVLDISMGVRKDDRALRREIDGVLTAQAAEIQALLKRIRQ